MEKVSPDIRIHPSKILAAEINLLQNFLFPPRRIQMTVFCFASKMHVCTRACIQGVSENVHTF